MIKVEARKTKLHCPNSEYLHEIPHPAIPVEDGSEERYLDPSDNLNVSPSDYEGWGAEVEFPNGNTWVVKREPKELVRSIENHR